MLAAAASLAAVATHERVRAGTAADGKVAAHAEPLTAGRARAWDARRRQASRRGRRRTDRSGLHRRLPSCTRRAGRGPRRWPHARSARAPGSFDPPGRRPRAKRDRTMRELKPKGSMTPLASAGCKSDIVSNGLPTVDAFAVAGGDASKGEADGATADPGLSAAGTDEARTSRAGARWSTSAPGSSRTGAPRRRRSGPAGVRVQSDSGMAGPQPSLAQAIVGLLPVSKTPCSGGR
jgi:hypothetical protein